MTSAYQLTGPIGAGTSRVRFSASDSASGEWDGPESGSPTSLSVCPARVAVTLAFRLRRTAVELSFSADVGQLLRAKLKNLLSVSRRCATGAIAKTCQPHGGDRSWFALPRNFGDIGVPADRADRCRNQSGALLRERQRERRMGRTRIRLPHESQRLIHGPGYGEPTRPSRHLSS
jgi:hypothetical protein